MPYSSGRTLANSPIPHARVVLRQLSSAMQIRRFSAPSVRYSLSSLAVRAIALATFAVAASLCGQAVSPTPEPAAPPSRATRPPVVAGDATGESPLQMSPFEVVSDRDTGYLATSTLAGTRIRSDLKDVAASISVVTKDFMEDIAANDLENLLTYTLGTEVAGAAGNFSNAEAGGAGEGLNFNSALERVVPGTRVRGLTSADSTRGFFASSIPVDSYNMERAEISRGPNATLFGIGSPAGIINNGLIRAALRDDKTKVKHQMGSYGSARYEFDHDQTLIRDRLGLRLATVYDKTYYRIHPAYSERKAIYGTSTWYLTGNTSLRVSGEVGEQNQNRPQYRPPYDSTSHWWNIGRPSYNPATGTLSELGPAGALPANTTGFTTGVMGWAGNSNFAMFYSDPNSSEPGIPGTGAQAMKTTSERVYRNAANTGWTSTSSMRMVNNANYYYNALAAGQASNGYWKMPSITDPTVYDFYHYQLDGPNKYEWADWRAFNAAIEQRFLKNIAGIELVYDWQDMNFGAQQPLSYVDYNIRLDINSHLTNGAPNPNYLRPFIGGYGSARRNGETNETVRATGYLDLDFPTKGPRWLGRLLGRHTMSGAYTDAAAYVESLSGPAFASTPDYWLTDTAGNPPVASASNNRRQMPQVRYIGDSVLGLPDASALRVQSLMASQWPTHLSTVRVLYHQPPATTATTPNPYVLRDWGVISQPYKEMTYVTGGSRRETTVESMVFVDQVRWLDSHVVGTLGWRRDKVKIANAGSPTLDASTGLAYTDGEHYPLRPDPNGRTGNSFNWGVVGHAPRQIVERLPWGTKFSVTFNTADNFRVAGQRENLYGEPIGPERGESTEWGFRISTFNGRFELRTNRYENNTLLNATPAFATSISNLVDAVSGVLDNNYSGINDTTESRLAGKAAWEAWMRSPEGERYMRVFRFQQLSPTDWTADRRANQVVGTTDITATGWENELIFNPLRNWRISFNVARQQAIRSNIGKEYIAVLENFKQLAAGPGGDALSSATEIFRNRLRNNTLTPANPIILQEGSPSAELRKWRWNLVTNYSFTSGFLKGVGLGGATRIQDKGVIGYPYYNHPTMGPAPDIANAYYARGEHNFDAWISYGRRFGKKINWKGQLNVKNIGVGNELIAIGAQPDGSIHSWRIPEPQRWTLTNTFTF